MTAPVHVRVVGKENAYAEVDSYDIGPAEVCVELGYPYPGQHVVEFFDLDQARALRDALSAAIEHQETQR